MQKNGKPSVKQLSRGRRSRERAHERSSFQIESRICVNNNDNNNDNKQQHQQQLEQQDKHGQR